LLRWKWLEENLKYAIATSTSNTVWFYNQKVDWWQGKVNDTLTDIIAKSKTAFLAKHKNSLLMKEKFIQPKCNNVNSGSGYYYSADAKKPMESGNIAFTFNWFSNKKILSIKYFNKTPDSLKIYVNNSFLMNVLPKTGGNSIPIKTFVHGNISVLTKYENNVEACGLEFY
jgi:hypothetical protein